MIAVEKYPESFLLEPLLAWLRNRQRIREDTITVPEFPWHGRLIDLAVLTKTQSSSAFELKLNKTRKALHQAALNGVSFDRSYVVLATRPSGSNLDQARDLGVGVIVIDPLAGSVQELIKAPKRIVYPIAKKRLRAALQERAPFNVL